LLFQKTAFASTCAAVAIALALTACGGSVEKSSPVPKSVSGSPSPSASDAGTSNPAQPAGATVIDQIQNRSGWEHCLATFSDGTPCAAGRGEADAWMAQHQTQPSMSGSSSVFHIGGATPYSNSLWWDQLGANSNSTHFTYDFWVYAPTPERPQAIEFDVNQSFGGTRWIFGTECNFAGTGKWDVWDGSAGQSGKWKPSSVSCERLKPNTWTHFVWNFERSGQQVHYISVTINGTEHSVDMWLGVQQNFPSNTINVAVQLDGDFQQQPYEVFVDNMKLTYW
jgi:hypothetical protein